MPVLDRSVPDYCRYISGDVDGAEHTVTVDEAELLVLRGVMTEVAICIQLDEFCIKHDGSCI